MGFFSVPPKKWVFSQCQIVFFSVPLNWCFFFFSGTEKSGSIFSASENPLFSYSTVHYYYINAFYSMYLACTCGNRAVNDDNITKKRNSNWSWKKTNIKTTDENHFWIWKNNLFKWNFFIWFQMNNQKEKNQLLKKMKNYKYTKNS